MPNYLQRVVAAGSRVSSPVKPPWSVPPLTPDGAIPSRAPWSSTGLEAVPAAGDQDLTISSVSSVEPTKDAPSIVPAAEPGVAAPVERKGQDVHPQPVPLSARFPSMVRTVIEAPKGLRGPLRPPAATSHAEAIPPSDLRSKAAPVGPTPAETPHAPLFDNSPSAEPTATTEVVPVASSNEPRPPRLSNVANVAVDIPTAPVSMPGEAVDAVIGPPAVETRGTESHGKVRQEELEVAVSPAVTSGPSPAPPRSAASAAMLQPPLQGAAATSKTHLEPEPAKKDFAAPLLRAPVSSRSPAARVEPAKVQPGKAILENTTVEIGAAPEKSRVSARVMPPSSAVVALPVSPGKSENRINIGRIEVQVHNQTPQVRNSSPPPTANPVRADFLEARYLNRFAMKP